MMYDREALVTVLVYHQPTSTSGCHCGWGVLGASHSEHVADVYEQSVGALRDDSADAAPECVCAMTESSMNRCPVHGPDAPSL